MSKWHFFCMVYFYYKNYLIFSFSVCQVSILYRSKPKMGLCLAYEAVQTVTDIMKSSRREKEI